MVVVPTRAIVLDLRSGTYEGSVESVLGEGFPKSRCLVCVCALAGHRGLHPGRVIRRYHRPDLCRTDKRADWRYELLGVMDQDGLVDADLIRTVRGELVATRLPESYSITTGSRLNPWRAISRHQIQRTGTPTRPRTSTSRTCRYQPCTVPRSPSPQSSLDTLLVDYQRDGSDDQLLLETAFGGWTFGTDDNGSVDLFLFKDGQLQMVTQTGSEVATGFESGQALFDGSRAIFVALARSTGLVPGRAAGVVQPRHPERNNTEAPDRPGRAGVWQ